MLRSERQIVLQLDFVPADMLREPFQISPAWGSAHLQRS